MSNKLSMTGKVSSSQFGFEGANNFLLASFPLYNKLNLDLKEKKHQNIIKDFVIYQTEKKRIKNVF